MRAGIVTVQLLGVLVGACNGSPINLGGNPRPVGVIAHERNNKLDILFVIDNSRSMSEEQMALAQWAGDSLFGTLTQEIVALGEEPSLHIGVVSSDVGTGGQAVGGCVGAGDDGILQNLPRVPNCNAPSDAYIVHEETDQGTTTNYAGTLGEAFACIAQLGSMGCGFEQHLESAKRALDGTRPQNAGFLRADANLLVVVVADEDDCSANNAQLFDPTQTSINDPLGPLTSFRCVEFGLTCDDQQIARAPAQYTECTAQEQSPYLHHPREYADFFKGLKSDASMVMVAALVGPPDDGLTVELNQDGDPEAAASCMSAAGLAYPGHRFRSFLDEFPARNRLDSICAPSFAQPMQSIAETTLDVVMARPCITESVNRPDACSAFDVVNYGSPNETRVELPQCARNNNQAPCFALDPAGAECAHAGSTYTLRVERDTPPGPGVTLLECP